MDPTESGWESGTKFGSEYGSGFEFRSYPHTDSDPVSDPDLDQPDAWRFLCNSRASC